VQSNVVPVAEAIVHVVGILDSVGILNVRSEDRALSP